MGCGSSVKGKQHESNADGCASVESNQINASANAHADYTISKKLGEGATATVRLGQERATGQSFAVKITKCDAVIPSELAIWRLVGSHQHCITLIDSYVVEPWCYFVMELCTSSLEDLVEEMSTTRVDNLARIFREMLFGLQHMHRQGIVHRDVKLDNYLCTSKDDSCVIKIADFGSAVAKPKEGVLREPVGTAPYMSPEMLKDEGYCEKTDLWSFGVSLYIILFGDFPYSPEVPSATAMKAMICRGTPAPPFRASSDIACDEVLATTHADKLVRALLERNPAERFSTEQALEHRFCRRGTTKEGQAELDGEEGKELTIRPKDVKSLAALQPWQERLDPKIREDMEQVLQGLEAGGGGRFTRSLSASALQLPVLHVHDSDLAPRDMIARFVSAPIPPSPRVAKADTRAS